MAVETGWRRRFPCVELSQSEIERLLAPYFPSVQVHEVAWLDGGLRNTNYRLQLSSYAEPVVLRLFSSQDELAAGACGREAALLHLVESRVPVARVLHSAPEADPPWNLVTWVDSIRCDLFLKAASTDQVESTSRSAGRALAAIHAFEFPRPGWFGADLSIGPAPW